MICLLAFWFIAIVELDHILSAFIALGLGRRRLPIFQYIPARIMLGNAGGLAFGAN